MNLQIEIAQYNKTFKTYCKERNQRPEIAARALELLDEMKRTNESSLLSWLTGEGSTLLLLENLSKTSYFGGKHDNTPETLNDFNAFTLLDTVNLYNKRTWNL